MIGRLPLLLVAALAIIAGVVRAATEGQESRAGWLILGAGLLMLGAWVADYLAEDENEKDKD